MGFPAGPRSAHGNNNANRFGCSSENTLTSRSQGKAKRKGKAFPQAKENRLRKSQRERERSAARRHRKWKKQTNVKFYLCAIFYKFSSTAIGILATFAFGISLRPSHTHTLTHSHRGKYIHKMLRSSFGCHNLSCTWNYALPPRSKLKSIYNHMGYKFPINSDWSFHNGK